MRTAGLTPSNLAAGIALLVLAGVWSWWAAKEGGYFGTVMYPGIVLLCAVFVLITSRSAWKSRVCVTTPARVALGALVALAGWSALSAFWSPAPDVAVEDAQRMLGYALAFGLGIWLTLLLREQIHLAMAPLAIAALFGGVVTVVALLSGDDYTRYLDDGTLQYPLGYRNANAAFFLIALWPAIFLAASREVSWPLRALALGTATMSLELAMLSQSRGSVIAAAAAIVVLLIVSRERARAVSWLALAVIPAMVVIPALTDLYDAGGATAAPADELRAAGRAVLLGVGLAVAAGALAAFFGRRMTPSPHRAAGADRAVAIGAVALALAGAAGFVVATGDPGGWIDDRVDEFFNRGSPGEGAGSSRFGADAGTERDDLWRVAVNEAGDDPLLGSGGGGFQYGYLRERSEEGIQSVHDAHSVELELLTELGLPGLALFLVVVCAAAAGAWGARGRGPAAAALSACALTAGAYWLAHTSLDWFWTYPVVTAPVFALLGSACAAGFPAATEQATTGIWRRLAMAGVGVLALSVVPPFLAERYVESAYTGWRTDAAGAQDNLDRARALNPLSLEPLLAEGGIAREQGDRDRAIAAFEEAAEKRPEEWATHYFLAALTRTSDPARARAEIDLALERNPLSDRVQAFDRRLRREARRRATAARR